MFGKKKKKAPDLSQAREELFRLEAGGGADHPIDVVSPAQIEPRAESKACPSCGGALRVLAHEAEVLGEARLRKVTMACKQCGRARVVWFRVGSALPS